MFSIKDELKRSLDANPEIQKALIGLKNSTVLVTGSTGFMGKWVMHALKYVSEDLNIPFTLIPFLGDIRDINTFPKYQCDFIIHLAGKNAYAQARETIFTNVQGITNLVKYASVGHKKILFMSSGAATQETAYGISKLCGEKILKCLEKEINFTITRGFSFIGPYMPLHIPFALTSFIKNYLKDETIQIKSNGKTIRSYLYAPDMAIHILGYLLLGSNSAIYNLGARRAIKIEDLATMIAQNKMLEIEYSLSPEYSKDYFPWGMFHSFTESVSLKEAIEKTLDWYESQ